MATLTLRGVKGSALTYDEVDDNFTNLNTAKLESGDVAAVALSGDYADLVGAPETGTATLNFGAAPGTNVATVTVTGQTGILSGSKVEAWLMGDSTASHNAYEHLIVPLVVRCGNIVAGTGFDIVASSDLRLTGTFSVHWTWA